MTHTLQKIVSRKDDRVESEKQSHRKKHQIQRGAAGENRGSNVPVRGRGGRDSLILHLRWIDDIARIAGLAKTTSTAFTLRLRIESATIGIAQTIVQVETVGALDAERCAAAQSAGLAVGWAASNIWTCVADALGNAH